MTFELTDSLKSSLLNALENQSEAFVVDAAKACLVSAGDDESGSNSIDEENFYSIPEWTSEDGFDLRTRFAENLRSPIVHDELMEVLHSGRGVFRNFKEVIKQYPEVEKLWHRFKTKEMLGLITDWYNSLREVWGLEKLDQIPELDDTPVYDDFSFEEYDSKYAQEIRQQLGALLDGSNSDLPAEVSSAFQTIWQNQFDADYSKCENLHGSVNAGGIVCRSLSDDFAGCILVKPVCGERKNVILVTNFFVSARFRGLGIGTELLSKLVSNLQSTEEKWLVMPNFIIPETLKPLLLRTGFVQYDFGFLLKI